MLNPAMHEFDVVLGDHDNDQPVVEDVRLVIRVWKDAGILILDGHEDLPFGEAMDALRRAAHVVIDDATA